MFRVMRELFRCADRLAASPRDAGLVLLAEADAADLRSAIAAVGDRMRGLERELMTVQNELAVVQRRLYAREYKGEAL